MKSIGKQHKPRCLIGCSGSVATLKLTEMYCTLSEFYDVIIVLTKSASFFLNRSRQYNKKHWEQFIQSGGHQRLLTDEDEWDCWNKIGDPVLHIELRRWADVFLIAPASADLLAKASAGISDNLLLSVLRAWDYGKPIVVCPAMNTLMWENPATSPAISTLKSWGCTVLGPVEKLLACNDRGNGAMVSVGEITDYLIGVAAVLSTKEWKDESIRETSVNSVLRKKKEPSIGNVWGNENLLGTAERLESQYRSKKNNEESKIRERSSFYSGFGVGAVVAIITTAILGGILLSTDIESTELLFDLNFNSNKPICK